MKIEMPVLPYADNALEPVISRETIGYHYGKHLQNYVNTLASLVKDTPWSAKSVEELVAEVPEGPLFNNAGQTLNHALYFTQFMPAKADNQPTGTLLELINRDFGSFDTFKEQFTQAALTLFGSGWAWLAQQQDGRLVIRKESNAGNPLRHHETPLLGIDVWEHAYYIDYFNRRADHCRPFGKSSTGRLWPTGCKAKTQENDFIHALK